MSATIQQTNHCYWISSPQLATALNCESFDIDALMQAGAVDATAEGRANAWFIRLRVDSTCTVVHHAVLRHYYRGGQIAKLTPDRFIWSGIKNSRAVAEYHLLEWMQTLHLPAPEPLGARVIKQGLFYTCDLITREIENAQTLAARLENTPMHDSLWKLVGATIRQFHDHRIWHSDLNANNLLLANNQEVSLIDFDRCKVRAGESWKNKNLLRLRRSLDKQCKLGRVNHFSESNWQALLMGYQGE